MRQSIRGYADGLIDTSRAAGNTAAVASDLRAVAEVVKGSEDLGRVLNDANQSAATRRNILGDLFGSQISPEAVRMLSFLVGSDRAAETTANIEWAAGRLEAGAQNWVVVGEVTLGRRSAEERVEGYTAAVLDTVERGRPLDELEDELFRFSRIVAGSDELAGALSDRDLPEENRQNVVRQLLAGRSSAATSLLATYPARVGRPRDYESLLVGALDRVASENQRRLADVRSAVEMDEQQQARLAESLERALGYQVDVRVSVDPTLLGGFVANIGDTVVDASARHQLDLLRERLVMPEVNITTGERH